MNHPIDKFENQRACLAPSNRRQNPHNPDPENAICSTNPGTSIEEESYLEELLASLSRQGIRASVVCRPENIAGCLRTNDYIIEIEDEYWLMDQTSITWPENRTSEIREYNYVLKPLIDDLGQQFGIKIALSIINGISGNHRERKKQYLDISKKIEMILNSQLDNLNKHSFHELSDGVYVQFLVLESTSAMSDLEFGLIITGLSRTLFLIDNFILDTGKIVIKKLSKQLNKVDSKHLKVGLCLDQWSDPNSPKSPMINTLISPYGIKEGIEKVLATQKFDLDGVWLRTPDRRISRLI